MSTAKHLGAAKAKGLAAHGRPTADDAGHGSPSDLSAPGLGTGAPAAFPWTQTPVAFGLNEAASPGHWLQATPPAPGNLAPDTTANASLQSPTSSDTLMLAASSSTLSAKAAPTSTAITVSKVYQHWADGDAATGSTAEWNNNILSANKSDYMEGEVIPHMFAYKASNNAKLVPDGTTVYYFNITYNYYQANTNAGGFTGLDTFDINRHPNSWPAGSAPTGDSTFTNNGGMHGLFYTVNADIVSVSPVGYLGTGTLDGYVTVGFKYTGPATTSSDAALIYYGLRIAAPGDVPDKGLGPTLGAHVWTGGSLQTTVDIGGSGATSIQLSPSAILYPGLAIDKTVVGVYQSDGITPDSDGIADQAGDIIKYNVHVTNTGQVKLTGVTVTDPLTGLNISGVTLAAGASADYASQYTVKQTDLDSKGGGDFDIDNTATADSDQTPPASDSEAVPLAYTPALMVDKAFTGVDGGNGNTLADAANDVLHYSVTVTNTGNITLTGVTVVDPLTGQNISGVTLAPQETKTYTTQYTLQQADLDGKGGGDGFMDNTATADSNETAPTSDSEKVPLVYTPALQIDKAFAGVSGGNGNTLADAANDVLHYTVTVTNTGNVTLTGVTVVDPLTGQNISGVTLAPNESKTYETSYTLKQGDLDDHGGGDGDIDNTATADSDQTGPTSDSEAVTLVYEPALKIDKVFMGVTGGNENGVADQANEVLHYTVTVSNEGNVTLTGVTVQDPLTGQNISGVTLAPHSSQSFDSAYTLTQADLDDKGGGDGDMDNTATADSNETGPTSDSETVPLVYAPGLKVDKVFMGVTGGNENGVADQALEVLHYQVVVSNTGNITLTGVTVQDPLTGQNISGLTLAPQTSQSFDTAYTLQQADLDNHGGGDGLIDNTAMADSDQTDRTDDSEHVPLVYDPQIEITKTFDGFSDGNGNDIGDWEGDVLHYTVTVSNRGNITLTGVTVKDPLTGQDIKDLTLAPNESQSYATTYVLTQADLDNHGGGDNAIDNTATADSNETAAVSASAIAPLTYMPSMAIDKVFTGVSGGNGNGIADAAGDILHYTITVSNTDSVTLTHVTVKDPLTGLDISEISIPAGKSVSYEQTYTLTQADLDNWGGGDGLIDNTATADSNETEEVSDTEHVPLVYAPAMAIYKDVIGIDGGNGNGVADAVGDVIHYAVSVRNPGNITLTGVTVADPLTGLSIGDVSIAPGQTQVWDASYTLTQDDLNTRGGGDGDIDNTASADSNETDPMSASAAVPLEYRPAMSLDKHVAYIDGGNGNGVADADGDVIHYTLTVHNLGNTTLTGVWVDDPLTALKASIPELAPGDDYVWASSYTLTQAELDSNWDGPRQIDNVATAGSDQTASISDDEAVPVLPAPALYIDKVFDHVDGGNGNAFADADGDLLHYVVTVSNQGNITLTDVVVKDPSSGIDAYIASLAPGASMPFDGSYQLTQNDLDTKTTIFDTASAWSHQTAMTTDNEDVQLVRYPVLVFNKFFTGISGGNGNGLADAPGDHLNYGFYVANAGNITLTDVSVVDPMTGFAKTGLTLAPGQFYNTWTTSYELTQADLDSKGGGDGYIDDTATADSLETPAINDTESVPLKLLVGMRFNESFLGVTDGNGNGLADSAGDVLHYRFSVTNAGNVTLTGVSIQDDLTGFSLSGESVDPGATKYWDSSYSLTQADLDGRGGGDGLLQNASVAQSAEAVAMVDGESVTLIHAPALNLTKYVSVDNAASWVDANAPTAPIPTLASGQNPLFKFEVSNVGNVTLAGVDVTDSAYDLNGLEDGEAHHFDALAPGETASWIYTDAVYQAGLQSDIATAVASGMPLVTDTDNAYYLGA